jgi:CheY-like chemotaxis protein
VRSIDPLEVLLVEDDPTNRLLFRAVLERSRDRRLAAARVTEAPTLAVARQRLDETPTNVVVLDVRLPDGDGLDLARELAARPGAQRPRVLIMSASVLPAERNEALAAGCDAFLGKPFRTGELEDVLATLAR